MFFWNSCFFHDPADVGNLFSGSSAFSKTSLNIWKFMIHTLLKPGLENFEHYFTSMWGGCNCAVVWAFFGIGMKLTFSSPVAMAELSKFADILNAALLQPHSLGILNSSAGISSPPLALFSSRSISLVSRTRTIRGSLMKLHTSTHCYSHHWKFRAAW